MSLRTAILAAVAIFAIVPAAQADLIGSTVQLTDYFPDLSTVFRDSGTAVVGGTVEFPGAGGVLSGDEDVDITGNQIILTELIDGPYATAAFNGYVLTILSGPIITGVSFDASSTETISDLTFDAHHVFINMQGVSIPAVGATVVINVTTADAVPEPLTLSLFGAGLAGMASMRKRKAAQV